jgi:hypothetical protein
VWDEAVDPWRRKIRSILASFPVLTRGNTSLKLWRDYQQLTSLFNLYVDTTRPVWGVCHTAHSALAQSLKYFKGQVVRKEEWLNSKAYFVGLGSLIFGTVYLILR